MTNFGHLPFKWGEPHSAHRPISKAACKHLCESSTGPWSWKCWRKCKPVGIVGNPSLSFEMNKSFSLKDLFVMERAFISTILRGTDPATTEAWAKAQAPRICSTALQETSHQGANGQPAWNVGEHRSRQESPTPRSTDSQGEGNPSTDGAAQVEGWSIYSDQPGLTVTPCFQSLSSFTRTLALFPHWCRPPYDWQH